MKSRSNCEVHALKNIGAPTANQQGAFSFTDRDEYDKVLLERSNRSWPEDDVASIQKDQSVPMKGFTPNVELGNVTSWSLPTNLKEIQEQISAQTDAQLIQRVSRRVARWRIVYQKMLIDVIYDIKRSTIVTFLYPD